MFLPLHDYLMSKEKEDQEPNCPPIAPPITLTIAAL